KPDGRFWLVYRIDQHRPIGVTSLTGIGDPPGTASFRILIGAPADRGLGFGEAASRLVLDHAFADLRLDRVTLDVFGYNEPARRPQDRSLDLVRVPAARGARPERDRPPLWDPFDRGGAGVPATPRPGRPPPRLRERAAGDRGQHGGGGPRARGCDEGPQLDDA